MLKFIHQSSKITSNTLVVCVSQIKNLDEILFLKLDAKILWDIKNTIKKGKSKTQEYFLWGKKYKALILIFIKEDSEKDAVSYVWSASKNLPENICICIATTHFKQEIYKTIRLSRYLFDTYKTEKKKNKTEVLCSKKEEDIFSSEEQLVQNIFTARDLWETPASDLTPEIFAKIVKKTKFKNIKVKILSYKDIQKKWLWLIEWVWKWSENKPCMVILEYIVDKKKPSLGLIGKGVTFDTWWNQIKPWDFMYDMKWDMWWAAVTFATMKELDRHSIDKNIVACLCLAENVVSSNAYKPSDILTWYTWKTVEIIHTDAEWRLVMADGISYIGKNYKTNKIITIATLTGACMVALWYRYAGVMGNDKKMIEKLKKYSKNHSEQYFELPFDDYLISKTKSKIADYNNLDRSVHAGASMWAAFLSNFLENNELYTHIDIAGTYINEWEAYWKMPKWMTGFWVESLTSILRD